MAGSGFLRGIWQIRACSHKMNVGDFEHNFGEYKGAGVQ